MTVRKASPDLMMVVHMISPDGSRDQQYISNYATLYIKDVLARLDGVGNVHLRRARLFDARLARSRKSGGARPYRGRGRGGAPGGELAGGGWRHQSAAGEIRGGFQLSVQTWDGSRTRSSSVTS